MLHSLSNEVLFQIRSLIRFRRPHYRERGEPLELSPMEHQLVNIYGMQEFTDSLSPLQLKRNLATLWLLQQNSSWSRIEFAKDSLFLDVGCQDFSRLPALKAFFAKKALKNHFTGIEVDPFPILSDLHSRWDRAQYYMSLVDSASYLAADFFSYNQKVNGIFCFFPFVSVLPALRWGLPARFANADKWVEGFLRCLQHNGFLYLVHQGRQEQERFDQARSGWSNSLRLLERHELSCPFLPPKVPSMVSLYQRI